MSTRFENILRQIVRFTLGTVAFLSFFAVLGTIGAIELGDLELGAGAIRCLVGMGVFGVSFWLVN